MSNIQQKIEQDNDSYPDLQSDEEKDDEIVDTVKKKIKTQNQSQPIQQSNKLIPSFQKQFLAGKFPFPLPLPSEPRPTNIEPPQIRQPITNNYPRPNRDRKNCLYIKNIPKCYNQNEKLMTFFRSYGVIKEIKINQDQYQVMVRFKREQDVQKLINSQIKIFNRSYITYSLNENQLVPINLIKQRQNDQLGITRKPFEMQIKQMKDRIEQILTYKYRGLLFLYQYVIDQQIKKDIENLLTQCKNQKFGISKLNDQQTMKISSTLLNDYDWALSFCRKSQTELDKKALITQFEEYGPINTININTLNNLSNQNQQKQIQSIITINYLSPRSSWRMYSFHMEKPIEVQGSYMKSMFCSGNLKCSQPIKVQNEDNVQEQDQIKNENNQEQHKNGQQINYKQNKEQINSQQPNLNQINSVKHQNQQQKNGQHQILQLQSKQKQQEKIKQQGRQVMQNQHDQSTPEKLQ